MALIPQREFAKLRLEDFLIGQMETEPLEDWEFLDRIWVGEKVCNFTHFLRLKSDPKTLRCVELDLSVEPQRVWISIFDRIGIPLRQGMTKAEVSKVIGGKPATKRSPAGRDTAIFSVTDGDPYQVRCTFNPGLVHVMILRTDPIG